MLVKTEGIVLRSLKYSDSQVIADVLTEEAGCVSFIQAVGSGRRARVRLALFQPLTRLTFEYDDRGSLHRFRSVQAVPYASIPYEPAKATVALFLSEFLYAAVRREPASPLLYRYIREGMAYLDTATEAYSNFHLVFLLRLSRFFGFSPDAETFRDGYYFDLQAGVFCLERPLAHFLEPAEARVLPALLRMNYATMHLFRLSGEQRALLLEGVNTYYRLHIPDFPELKSLRVLQDVFAR